MVAIDGGGHHLLVVDGRGSASGAAGGGGWRAVSCRATFALSAAWPTQPVLGVDVADMQPLVLSYTGTALRLLNYETMAVILQTHVPGLGLAGAIPHLCGLPSSVCFRRPNFTCSSWFAFYFHLPFPFSFLYLPCPSPFCVLLAPFLIMRVLRVFWWIIFSSPQACVVRRCIRPGGPLSWPVTPRSACASLTSWKPTVRWRSRVAFPSRVPAAAVAPKWGWGPPACGLRIAAMCWQS